METKETLQKPLTEIVKNYEKPQDKYRTVRQNYLPVQNKVFAYRNIRR